MKSLGERCVDWCLSRAAEEPLPSIETLAIWFEPVERDGKVMSWLSAAIRNQGKRYNHCAAAQCAAALECAYDDDVIPHRPRAAAKELRADAIEAGVWHELSEILAGEWVPRCGDLVIYDRYNPGNPNSQPWHGHVDRAIRMVSDTRVETIGANEVQGRWRQEIEDLADESCRALGVIAYPVEVEYDAPKRLLTDDDVERIKAEVAGVTDDMVFEYWEQWHR